MIVQRSIAMLACATTLAATPFSLLAQQSDPGVIDRTVPTIDLPDRFRFGGEVAPLTDAPTLDTVPNGDEIMAYVCCIVFTGVTVMDPEILRDIGSQYVHRNVTRNDLEKLKFDVTRAYYEQGNILVKTVTPPQELSDGVLKVEIYEARIGQVVVHDNGLVHPVITSAMVGQVDRGKVFHESDTESMITDLRDLSGVDASMALQKGEEFGETDMHVYLEEVDDHNSFASIDNYGSQLTGKYVGRLHMENGNLLGLGEKYTLDLRASDEDLYGVEVAMETPIGISNVKLETSYGYTENEIGAQLASIGASGETHRGLVGLKSDVVNTRDDKVTLRGGLEMRQHEAFINGTETSDDDIRRLYGELSYLTRMPDTVLYASGRSSIGVDVFGASEDRDADLSRATGDPDALILEGQLVGNHRLLADGFIRGVFTGQYADEDLLSSDLFTLGGYGSVRGFEPAQASGEKGVQFSVEYNHVLDVHPDYDVRVGPFFDGGAVWNYVGGSVPTDSELYGAGIGAEIRSQFFPELDDTVLRLDYAWPVGGYTDREVEDDGGVFYFRLTQGW